MHVQGRKEEKLGKKNDLFIKRILKNYIYFMSLLKLKHGMKSLP